MTLFTFDRIPTPDEIVTITQYAFVQHLNYKCKENPPGSENYKCDDDEDRIMEKHSTVEFSDPKKTYSVTPTGTGKFNGNTRATFDIQVTSPIRATQTIKPEDITTKQGVTGFYADRYSDITKALKATSDVFVSLSPEAADYIRKTGEAEIQRLKDEAAKVEVKSWRWTDDGVSIFSPDDVSTEFRPDLEDIATKMKKHQHEIWKQMLDASEPVKSPSGYRWYNIPHQTMMNILNPVLEKEAERERVRNLPENVAKRDAENKKMSKVLQHWQDMEDIENSLG